ncbi:MAG: primase-like DNA-binding domain-containing protein [Methanoregula sp.]
MAGKKESSALWRQASVVIRADIFEQARNYKIDISEAVNRALAERLGIDYRQQKIPEGIIAEPVIIASNEAPALPDHVPAKPGAPAAAAIINADDPLAAKTIKTRQLVKEQPAPKVPAPVPVPVPAPEKAAPPLIASSPATGKAKKPAPKKKKDDAAKKFFASVILREDTESALIPKDDMYYAFERWCRDHRVTPVPDKKSFSVTLKNQFAVKEKMVNGTPAWVGVKVK